MTFSSPVRTDDRMNDDEAENAATKIEPPYGPGAVCDDCGHFAARHDPDGCHGVDPDVGCRFGDGGTEESPRQCVGMLWNGARWPEPWVGAA